MEALAVILKLFGSSAMGSVVGWIGGLANRALDLKAKRMEYDQALALRAVDRDIAKSDAVSREVVAKTEAEAKITTATIDGAARIESAAQETLRKSYEHDTSIKGGRKMEAFKAFMRPFTTMWFLTASSALAVTILYLAFWKYRIEFTLEDWKQLVMFTVQWVFFQAALCIGWWFANRPSDPPRFRSS